VGVTTIHNPLARTSIYPTPISPLVARFVLAKTAWAERYRGLGVGDDPDGAHGWISQQGHEGHEAYNFRRAPDGRYYGYFRLNNGSTNLARVDPSAQSGRLSGVTIVWISKPPKETGLRVVGWYSNATLLAETDWEKSPWKHPLYAEGGEREGVSAFVCFTRSAQRLPVAERRRWVLPKAVRTLMGRTDVLYPYEEGSGRQKTWVRLVEPFLVRIEKYAPDPEVKPGDHQDLEIDEVTTGQGFNSNSEERRLVEAAGMEHAFRYFRGEGYSVEDVSRSHSYDLRCTRGNRELHVEVKGTKGDGQSVILTKNEVAFHLRGGSDKVLYVLPKITVRDGEVVAVGLPLVFRPFDLTKCRRTPTQFLVELKAGKAS
jgi:hypothetical protein